jgi:tRNA nucleotidyltransferase (CCA-adding enzyme)
MLKLFHFLIQGDEIKKLLNLHPGPILGFIIEKEIEWMLEHPEATKDECIKWLKTTNFSLEKK